jgi:6-phosphogluconolactonase (cycloisomerase 2 family)
MPGAAGAFHLGFVETLWDGVGGVDGLGAAFSVAVSPDGAHLYVAAYADNAVAVLARNPAAGTLDFVETEWDGVGGVDGLAGAYAVAVSPDGAHLYVAGLLDHALAVFARNPTSGELTFVEVQRDGVGGVDGLAGASAVAVSPDGSNVYATGFWDHAVVVFVRHPSTGALSFVEVERDGVGGVEGLANAAGVAVSPDGAHVYTAAEGDSAVAVFARAPATGALAFVEAKVDGVGGVDGLAGATAVTVSPDGATVYAAGRVDSAVVVFARNPLTGALDFVEEQRNGQGGVAGMNGPVALTLSPEGHHVYVAAYGDGSVVTFSRDPANGRLTFVDFRNNSWGVDGLAGARSVAASPDGRHLYAAGADDNAVVVFVRMLFGDGFEWGTTTGWSATTP